MRASATTGAVSPARPSLSAAERRAAGPAGFRLESSAASTRASRCWPACDVAKQAGLDFLVLDQTRPDIEVPVVRVIVPGMRHFYRRFAPGRLYDVPVKLGWLDRPTPESELNPLASPYVRSCRLARSATKEPTRVRRARRRQRRFPPGLSVTSPCGAGERRDHRRFRRLRGRPRNAQRRARRSALRSPARRPAARARLRPAAATVDKEIRSLVRRLAAHGLVEYRLAPLRATARTRSSSSRSCPTIGRDCRRSAMTDTLVLSRFAYLRRRADELVLESPRAGALFRICDPKIAAALAMLSTPQPDQATPPAAWIFRGSSFSRCSSTAESFSRSARRRQWPAPGRGRRQPRALGFSRSSVPRPQHRGPARQSGGRRLSVRRRDGSAAGGAARLARHEDRSARRLGRGPRQHSRRPRSFCANVIRHAISTTGGRSRSPSWRGFSTRTARVQSELKTTLDHGGGGDGPQLTYTVRPYPSGGASYELELYLAVDTMRRTCARLLSLRRRRPRAGADRRPRPSNSKRCSRAPNSRWARPPRRRS